MFKLIRSLWRDSVGSEVIAAIILAIGGSLVGLFWSDVLSYLGNVLGWFMTKSSIPNWLLTLLITVSSVSALLVIWSLFSLIRRNEDNPQHWKDYKKDLFFGVVWRWEYQPPYHVPSPLYCFCPHCDYQLDPQFQLSRRTSGSEAILNCPDCFFFCTIKGDWSEIERKLQMKIQKHVRSGMWVNSFDFAKKKAACIPVDNIASRKKGV